MADQTTGSLPAVQEVAIGDLPAIADLYDDTLIPVEQQGEARHMTGAQWKKYAQAGVSKYVTDAQQASEKALEAASRALTAVDGIGTAVEDTKANAEAAEDAKAGAEDARAAIENMLVEAISLETGRPATVSKELVDGVVKLVFGLPAGGKGDRGDPGSSIQSITRTAGTGASGTTDTYTVTLTDGSTTEFYVYNGKDGTGAGDMSASVYDPQGKKTDVFQYVDDAVAAGKEVFIATYGETTNAEIYEARQAGKAVFVQSAPSRAYIAPLVIYGTAMARFATGIVVPGAGSAGVITYTCENDTWSSSTYRLEDTTNKVTALSSDSTDTQYPSAKAVYDALKNKQDALTGVQGQVVGFDADGNPVSQDAPEGGVTSFNGRTGAITPQSGDYTADDIPFSDGETFQEKYDSGELSGKNGESPTIGIGTVSTGEAGSSAAASLTGEYPDYKLNLTIPKGGDGDPGEKGDPGLFYATCATAAATTAKVATCSGFTLTTGAVVAVKFTYTNTAASPTLNVNSTGAKSIAAYGTTALPINAWAAGATVVFVYDGTQWIMNTALASRLATARTILTNLASTAAASFDGSANVTPGVTGTLGLLNGGTGVTSLAALKVLLGISDGAKIEVGTYAGDASETVTTPQSVPVAFTPKFVWVGALGIDAAPWHYYSDYDDTQSPVYTDSMSIYSAYAFTGFPWVASDSDGDLNALEISTAGFNVCNAVYRNTGTKIYEIFRTYLNSNKRTYFYLAIG